MRFSIRELLLVTVIVALAVGWWLDHNSLRNVARQATDDAQWLVQFTARADIAERYVPKLETLRERYDSDIVDK